jgi:hypothetical protein
VLDRSVPYHLDDRRTPPIIQSPTEKINPARRRSARTPSHKTCLLPGKVRLARGRDASYHKQPYRKPPHPTYQNTTTPIH